MYTRGHARACGISEKLINRGPCPAAAVHSYRGSTRTTLTAASARAHSHTPRHSASARCEKRLSSHPLTFSVEPSHRNNQDRSQRPTPRSVFVLPTLWMSSRSLVRCSLSLSLMSPVLLVLSASASHATPGRLRRLRRLRRIYVSHASPASLAPVNMMQMLDKSSLMSGL